MRGDRLNRNLDRLYRQPAGDLPQRQALEEELLHRYRQTHPRHRRWLMLLNPWNKTARFAVVGLALMLLAVGACTTETSTQIQAGQQGHIALKMSGSSADKSLEFEAQEQITDFISSQPGVEELNVSVREFIDDAGTVTADISLMIWGENLDAEALSAAIQAEFPHLDAADISFEPLSTTITESLFDRFGRQVFNIETEGSSAEEIRTQILQQLAAEGFTGDAQVEVINGDGTQEIKIMLEETIED
jgi:hypothetical protein